MSLNFNADGDKILTGSFDGTAIVLFLRYRFGIQNQAKPFMSSKDIPDKYRVLNLSSEDICAALHRSTKLAEFGT